MATISKFEELDCWQTALSMLMSVYAIMKKDEVRREFSFQDQIKRTALSVSNNIAEGFERKSAKERIRFLEYSNGILSEVKSMLYAALKLEFINQSEFDSTFALCEKMPRASKRFYEVLHSIKT